ncbi:MAG: LysR family transcriptional regulator [Erythrobacter sp.]
MDRLREYRALVAVIDKGGFTQAAEMLGIPRSTLSTMIAGLEDRVGARLLHRTTRVVTATDEGVRLAERARALIEEASSLETMFKGGQAVSGRVRLSLPGRIAHEIVIPALPSLIQDHPGLMMDLRISDEFLDLVSEGLDLVLRVGELRSSSLVCRTITKLDFVNCAAPAYLERHGAPKTIADLEGHIAVAYGQPDPSSRAGLVFGGTEASLPVSLAVDSTEGYVRAGLAGFGIISLPRYDVAAHLKSGRLREVLPDHPPSGSEITILYPSRKHLPLRLVTVRDWLIQIVTVKVARTWV